MTRSVNPHKMARRLEVSDQGSRSIELSELSHEKTNHVVSEQVRHKSGCTITEAGWNLEISRKCTIYIAKTKKLISFAVTAKLICIFVFTYADCWFSHETAHMKRVCVFSIYICNACFNNYPFFSRLYVICVASERYGVYW